MELRRAHSAFEVSDPVAELISSDRGHAGANASVIIEAPDIREAVGSSKQGTYAWPEMIVEAYKTHKANAGYTETPPWMEKVARAAWEPANIAKAKPETKSCAPTEE
jgi:hypothetical protein